MPQKISRLSRRMLESIVKKLNELEDKDIDSLYLTRSIQLSGSIKDFYFTQAEVMAIHKTLSNYKVKERQHIFPNNKRSKYKIEISKKL